MGIIRGKGQLCNAALFGCWLLWRLVGPHLRMPLNGLRNHTSPTISRNDIYPFDATDT
jgi:hypothetical protein